MARVTIKDLPIEQGLSSEQMSAVSGAGGGVIGRAAHGHRHHPRARHGWVAPGWGHPGWHYAPYYRPHVARGWCWCGHFHGHYYHPGHSGGAIYFGGRGWGVSIGF